MLLDKSKLLYALFDWDGTLADNRAVVIKSIEQVLAEYGLGNWDDVKKLRNPKLSLRDNFVNFFKDNAFAAYERYLQIYKLNSPQMLKSFPFAAEVIHYLKNQV